jgi:hypothetical protein
MVVMRAPLILVKCVVRLFQYLPCNHDRNVVVFLVFCLHITALPMPQESVVAEFKRTHAVGIAAESEGMVGGAIQQNTSTCQIAFESYLHKENKMNASRRGHVLILPNRMLHLRYGLHLNLLLIFYTKRCKIY